MESQVSFVIGQCHCVALRRDRYWGHGLEVSVYEAGNGDLLTKIHFCCHPEFSGFEQLQAMSTEQLASLAQTQLASGALNKSLQALNDGLTLFFRFETSQTS